MASLKKCKDCGHEISKSAESCPNCGRRYRRRWNEIGPFTSILVFGTMFLFLLSMCSQA
ncbi:MAG: zinc-ribbon domain-containing protein [Gammaproteobacteria bacterium]|nr:zinc-ribbon domain-containing protein [Gammaproteobacteria bacterium]